MATAVVGVTLTGSVSPAPASFRGRNGRVVFTGGYFEQGLTTGCTERSFHIYSVRLDGTGLRRLDPGIPGAGHPRWSADGRWVVFNGGGGSTRENEIYTVRRDGTRLRRLTNNRMADLYPAWAPGGRRLVYQRGRLKIAIMKRDGTDRRVIKRLETSLDALPLWSPDGRRIAFRASDEEGPGLFTMRPNGARVRTLIRRGGISSFDWSHSGKRLVVVLTTRRAQKIITMSRTGSDRRLIYEGSRFGETVWAPNGRGFLTIGTGDECGYDMFVLDRSGDVRRRLDPPNLSAFYPSWQPQP